MADPLQMPDRDRRRDGTRACACCIFVPVVIALGISVVYHLGGRVPNISLPGHVMPADNALDYFKRAGQLSQSIKNKNPYQMIGPPSTTNTLGNFRAFAMDAAPSLVIMREGLNHPFMSPAERTIDSVDSSWQKLYKNFVELERANSAAADYYAVTGQPDRAMEMRLDGLEMGSMTFRGSGVLGCDTGVTCEAIALDGIEPLIPRLSTSDLDKAASRIDKTVEKRVPYSDIILEEGFIQAAISIEAIGSRKEDYVKSIPFAFVNKSALLRKNLDWYAAMAAEVQGPFSGPSKIPIPGNYFAQLTGDALNVTHKNYVSIEATLTVLRVELALYSYKKEHKKFPMTLAELCPGYFPFVPLDPCDPRPAAPLRYIIKNGGSDFLLYSVGPDMSDNGGVAKQPGGTTGDIVAGKLFHSEPILASQGSK